MRTLIICSLLLVAVPALAGDDPRALAEAGWKAYQKHDLATAEKLTRQALAQASEVNVRAAALYNLGRILEDRNDKPGAIAAYRESLTARHNAVVRGRLATLDRAAAEEFVTFKPAPMNGPFATLEALCNKLLEGGSAEDRKMCASVETIKPRSPYKALPTVQDVQFIAPLTDAPTLAVKVGGAWYSAEIRDFQDNGHCRPGPTFEGVTAHGALLEVSFGFKGECNTRDGAWTWTERGFVIVGVGASKKPSVTPELRTEIAEIGERNKKTMDYLRKVTWGQDGSLDVAIIRSKGDSQAPTLDDTEDVRGHHALVFP